MLITNIEMVPGRRIKEHLGMVQGNTVRAKHLGRDLMAALKIFLAANSKAIQNYSLKRAKKRWLEWNNKPKLSELMLLLMFACQHHQSPLVLPNFLLMARQLFWNNNS